MRYIPMKKGIKDPFSSRAKKERFLARSVYKLRELDQKHGLFHKRWRGTLIDFGVSPGSWYQYYSKRLHSDVFVIGVDQKPFKSMIEKGVAMAADILDLEPKDFQTQGDVFCVLSDALPNLTGNRVRDHALIERLRDHICELTWHMLAPGGMVVIKTFDCPSHSEWVATCRRKFEYSKCQKPSASRKESPEHFFVGKGFLGEGKRL